MKYCIRIAWFVGLLLGTTLLRAQSFAPVEHYLVDSLDLATVSERDRQLVDSILTIYHDCPNDTCRINAVSVIVEASWDDNVWPRYNQWLHDRVQQLLPTVQEAAVQEFLQRALAGSLNNIGYFHNSRGETDKALVYYEETRALQQAINDKYGLAGTFVNIGFIYLNRGLIQQALDYYYASLKLQEEVGDQGGIATALNGIGYIHYKQGETEKALESYLRSLEIRETLDDQYGIATCYNNLGLLYKDQRQWAQALDYYQKGMAIQEALADDNGVAISLGNIGRVYANQEQWGQALTYYENSLKMREEQDDRNGIALMLNSVAGVYLAQGKLAQAHDYASRSLELAQTLNFPVTIRDAAETMTALAERQRRWKDAVAYHKLFVEMRDSIYNAETNSATIRQEYKYQYEKIALADSIRNAEAAKLQDAQLAASKAESDRNRQLTYFLYGGLALVLAFTVLIYSRLRVIDNQKKFIEQQKEQLELQHQQLEEYTVSIEQQKQQLQDLNNELEQFAHVVSHDLKTPLRGIAGLVHIIEEDHTDLNEDLQSLHKLMAERVIRMNDLIDGVLSYSKVGRQGMKTEVVDLNKMLDTLIEELTNERTTTVEITTTMPSVHGNRVQLEQVFSNLIGNAIKYMDRDDGKVQVSCEEQGDMYVFSISDNGPGIEPNLHRTVFELFGKGHQSSRKDSAGIGLSIVKKLVNQNGGTISLTSENGQGACFSFTWPQ